jgi:hypothetical protein
MKVLLQHAVTECYLCAPGVWENEPNNARAFTNIQTALRYCHQHNMFAANVILAFDDADFNVSVSGPRPPR